MKQIYGHGEMAELTRHFDWSTTPIGPIEEWPDTLLSLVNVLLATRHPMFLWWGDDLIQFYNDAYRPSIREDKHPKALGQKGRDCWEEIWPVIGPQITSVMSRGEATWNVNQLIPIYRNRTLTDVYWTYSYSPVRDSRGAIKGTLVVCSETTEQVVAETHLRQSEARFRRLVEEANIGFVIGDLEGRLTYLNPVMLNVLGYTEAEVQRGEVSWTEITPPEYAELDANAVRELQEFGRCQPYQKAYVAKDGRRIPFLMGAMVISGPMGKPDEVAAFLADLTALKHTEEALRQTEKLAAVGRLASSIAHEINNPLESVTNLLYLAEHSVGDSETRKHIQLAQQELGRVTNIATQTLRFHRQSTNPTRVHITGLLRSVLTLFAGRLTNAGVSVELRSRGEEQLVCYENDLRQVFANLVSNSLDAMERGGRLMIRVRSVSPESITVTIADSGHGMSKGIIRRIRSIFHDKDRNRHRPRPMGER